MLETEDILLIESMIRYYLTSINLDIDNIENIVVDSTVVLEHILVRASLTE